MQKYCDHTVYVCMYFSTCEHWAWSHSLSVQQLVSIHIPFHVTKECFNMTEITSVSVQTITKMKRPNDETKSGSSVFHMHAQCGVAVIWKYIIFKPDDIRQAQKIAYEAFLPTSQ